MRSSSIRNKSLKETHYRSNNFNTIFLHDLFFTNDFSLALRRNAFSSVSRRTYKAGPLNVHGRTSFRDRGNDCEKITVNCFSTIRRSWTDDWVSMIGESIGENVSVSWLWNVLSRKPKCLSTTRRLEIYFLRRFALRVSYQRRCTFPIVTSVEIAL